MRNPDKNITLPLVYLISCSVVIQRRKNQSVELVKWHTDWSSCLHFSFPFEVRIIASFSVVIYFNQVSSVQDSNSWTTTMWSYTVIKVSVDLQSWTRSKLQNPWLFTAIVILGQAKATTPQRPHARETFILLASFLT